MNNDIYNSNIVFRCPRDLKDKMRSFAEAKGQALSSVIRTACVEYIKHDVPRGSNLRKGKD